MMQKSFEANKSLTPTSKARISYIRKMGFEHIADSIKLMWGSPELTTYLEDLILNPLDRHVRNGLPEDVFDCVLKLYHELDVSKADVLGVGVYKK